MKATIELNLYSGFRNPVWVVGGSEARHLLAAFEMLPMEARGFQPIAMYKEPLGRPRSGYRGLTIAFENGDQRVFEVFGDLVLDPKISRVRRDSQRQLERHLYSLMPTETTVEYLAGMSFEQVILSGHEARIQNIDAVPSELECAAAPLYEGDAGDFLTHRYVNNCYNYATKVVNKVPLKQALPGTPNVGKPLTMARLRAAVEDDGFVPLGMALDGSCPPEGSYYIAVLLRRSPSGAVRDFHCLRLDRNGVWSHKDGKGEVRNVDDNGNAIVDLAQAALSWEPELAGFYRFDTSNRGLIG